MWHRAENFKNFLPPDALKMHPLTPFFLRFLCKIFSKLFMKCFLWMIFKKYIQIENFYGYTCEICEAI